MSRIPAESFTAKSSLKEIWQNWQLSIAIWTVLCEKNFKSNNMFLDRRLIAYYLCTVNQKKLPKWK